MAVNTAEIGTLYDFLMEKAQKTLDSQFTKGRVKGSDYASVLASSINSAITTSVQTVQNQPILDEQKTMISNQANTEVEKKKLTIRQTTAYDDNLRVEEAKVLGNVTGMYGAGGTVLPTGLETSLLNAVAAITPVVVVP